MYLIEIFLPTFGNNGELFPTCEYERVRCDEIAIFEAMVEMLDRDWWARYREELELRFRQASVVMRSISFELL